MRIITSPVTAIESRLSRGSMRERQKRSRKYLVKRVERRRSYALNEIKSLTKSYVRTFVPRKASRSPRGD